MNRRISLFLVMLACTPIGLVASEPSEAADTDAALWEWFLQVHIRCIDGVDALRPLDVDCAVTTMPARVAAAVSATEIVRYGHLLAERCSEAAIRAAAEAGDWHLYQGLCVDYAMILDSSDGKRAWLLKQALDCSTSVSLSYYGAVAALELLDSEDIESGEAKHVVLQRCVDLIAAHLDACGMDWRGNALVNSLAYLVKIRRNDIVLQDVVTSNRKVGDLCRERLPLADLRKEIPEPVRCSWFTTNTVSTNTLHLFHRVLDDGHRPAPSCKTY